MLDKYLEGNGLHKFADFLPIVQLLFQVVYIDLHFVLNYCKWTFSGLDVNDRVVVIGIGLGLEGGGLGLDGLRTWPWHWRAGLSLHMRHLVTWICRLSPHSPVSKQLVHCVPLSSLTPVPTANTNCMQHVMNTSLSKSHKRPCEVVQMY